MTLDVKDLCLNFKLKEYKFILINLHLIPDDFIVMCNLKKLARGGKILAKMRSSMHRLR